MHCVTWPTPATRWSVSTGPSGRRKLGKRVGHSTRVPGQHPSPGTLTPSSTLSHPRPGDFCSRDGNSWAPMLRGAHSNQGLH